MLHIVVDTGLGKGPEEYGNMGDVSMLQVAVDRLQKLFPQSSIEVLTDSAQNLARFCPTARPLDNRGRALWFANGVLLGRFSDRVPKWLVDLLVRWKQAARSLFPELVQAILTWRFRHQGRPTDAEAVFAFRRAMQQADLLMICGAGGFYDGCRAWNLETLDLIEAAIERKIPVAMLGQGFGPLSDASVLKRAGKILPFVDFITLRGGRGSLDLLRSLGIHESKVQTTGDEAIELAYESRSEQCGQALGINIRFLASALTDENDVQRIRPVLQNFARQHEVRLIPLPIAIHFGTRDDLAIKQLLIGFDEQSDGGKCLDSPIKVIKQVSLCRLVVTGAYHAAVIALAQGIPVDALAKSAYFSNKLLGLEDQFGEGCQTIFLNERDFPQRLGSAIEKAWQNAERVRQPLQKMALRQIEFSRRSYERIRGLAASDIETTPGKLRL